MNNEYVIEESFKDSKLAIKSIKDVLIETFRHRSALITVLYIATFHLDQKAGIKYVINDIPIF